MSSVHPAKEGVQVELTELLLGRGAPPNGLDASGLPLKVALLFGYAETAKVLVERGAGVDRLFLAAGLGDLDRMKALLNDEKDKDALEKAFIYACKNDQPEAVSFLLDSGVDINAMPGRIHKNNCTGLHFAALGGRAEIAKLLIERGADLNLKDPTFDSTPLGWARHNEQKEMEEILQAAAEQDIED